MLANAPREVLAETIWLANDISSWMRKQQFVNAAANPTATHITREVDLEAPGFDEPFSTSDLNQIVGITTGEFAALQDNGICTPDVEWYTHRESRYVAPRLLARAAIIDGLRLSDEIQGCPLRRECDERIGRYYGQQSESGLKIAYLGSFQCILGYPRSGAATPRNAAFFMVDVEPILEKRTFYELASLTNVRM